MNKEDWLLLIIGEAGDRGLTPLRIQKSLFLIKQNLGGEIEGDFYDFEPYNYGPFCKNIYKDTDKLESEDLIRIDVSDNKKWIECIVTGNGKERVQKIKNSLSPNVLKYIEDLIIWISKLSFREIISYIYKKYPQFKENSIITW